MSNQTATRQSINEAETAALIRASAGRVLPLRFGPGWVALDNVPAAGWAVQELAMLRRYAHQTCATCGRTYQAIDFRGNPHVSLCSNPQVKP